MGIGPGLGAGDGTGGRPATRLAQAPPCLAAGPPLDFALVQPGPDLGAAHGADRGEDGEGPLSLLAEIRYGPAHRRLPGDGRRLGVGLAPLSAPGPAERWRTAAPVEQGFADGVGFAQGGGLLFAHLLETETWADDPARCTEAAYRRLLGLARARGCPHPLRIWNLLSGIHERRGGLDRYQAFCVGRERGLAAAGIAPAHYPAATAVGSAAPGLLVYLLAALSPGQPAENPRQVSAYRYPARYGPRPPSFARGLAWPAAGGGRFFVSGTASVVGHRSLHPGQLGPQLGETLVNLESLLQGARVGPPSFLKVFLRQPVHLAQAGEALRDWAPAGIPILYLSAQICREELEIEIEGLCGV